MKPKDLKSPYPFKKRRPCLHQGVFYVPSYYVDYRVFSFPSWQELFGTAYPIHIEYCSGNGEWIIDRAEAYPEINWVGVELKFERVRKIYSKMVNRGVKNLLIVCGDARIFTREYLKPNSVDAVYVNFPDPWPKHRHAKHRLIQSPFIEQLLNVVKPKGTIHLVSDAEDYIRQMREEVGKVPCWNPASSVETSSYGTSYFQRLWELKGREIYHLTYQNGKS
jgi:tRNA (guanine-N7-)-methyltransferase